ncbi:hypothetical protein ACFL6H_07565 [Candidatus Latescibacterota bacterium]
MYELLFDIFWIVFLINIFAFAVMVIFFINARINLRSQVANTRFFMKALEYSKTTNSSLEAAEMLNVSLDEFKDYCLMKGIESPEKRIEVRDRVEKAKQEEEQRILDEEATWRAEQEKVLEEKRKEHERAAQERKKRLKKFGFK